MATTIQLTDQYGGYVNFTKCIVTGYINIDILDGRTGEKKSMLVDPDDPQVMDYLKKNLQSIQLDILLGK